MEAAIVIKLVARRDTPNHGLTMSNVIVPSCVGRFFPSDADELRQRVSGYLAAAAGRSQATLTVKSPKAIIAPHAGYDYSGPVAAAAYAALAGTAHHFRRVVLLGTCHVSKTGSLLTTTADAFLTPLGRVPVDQDAVRQAMDLAQVEADSSAHSADHALAVQLPMLQMVLEEFQIVPLLVGTCSAVQVEEVLELLWGGNDTLVVVSSDLSHYFSYDEACRRDRLTAKAIERLDQDAIGRDDACGFRAIGGLLLSAKRHDLRAHPIDIRNSADTCGGRSSVVGYGAFVFGPSAQ